MKRIESYIPKNEQEKVDKEAILNFIKRNDDVLDRSNLIAHLTSSGIVVNKTLDKVLFIHHNIYNSWGWVGGHNDGDSDMLHVALKEATEETGVKNIVPYNDEIMMIDVIYVPNHIKHGKYVNDHVHLNTTFLLIADENEELIIKPDENSGVQWFPIDEAIDHITEPRMEPVYKKAFNIIKRLKNKNL